MKPHAPRHTPHPQPWFSPEVHHESPLEAVDRRLAPAGTWPGPPCWPPRASRQQAAELRASVSDAGSLVARCGIGVVQSWRRRSGAPTTTASTPGRPRQRSLARQLQFKGGVAPAQRRIQLARSLPAKHAHMGEVGRECRHRGGDQSIRHVPGGPGTPAGEEGSTTRGLPRRQVPFMHALHSWCTHAHLSVVNWSGDRLIPFLPGSCCPSCRQQGAHTHVRSQGATQNAAAVLLRQPQSGCKHATRRAAALPRPTLPGSSHPRPTPHTFS